MRRYNIINNSLGWFCFLIAAITYLLTIEPTASFWDCPEFITQGFKLEVGHPPGNPIFMLTARFFVTIFGGGAQTAAIAVNSMSALLSAATILLLFWTITHLVRRLIIKDNATNVSTVQMILIMAAGLCGSLAYTWSDTFWFSAVEGEVYAFSSFCTALVFWLILKWENRADKPGSDRYLILIAYIIGISIAVHLLNLLAIPAIVLIVYYRKFKNTNLTGSLIALAISFAIVVLILYGLVPGFISVASEFDLICVNAFGMGYNMGVLIYAIIATAAFIWTVYELRRQDSAWRIRMSMTLSIILSGMPFIGHGWVIPTLLIIALVVYLWGFCKKIPVRIFNVVIWSIFVIFIGYSSYALLLIRSTAATPMNQNIPDNPFSLASYLNREQYGDTPLLYGPKLTESIAYQSDVDQYGRQIAYLVVDENGLPNGFDIVGQKGNQIVLKYISPAIVSNIAYDSDGSPIDNGYDRYTPVIKGNDSQGDKYIAKSHKPEFDVPEGMGTIFPRMYSDVPGHVDGYKSWSLYETPEITVSVNLDELSKWASKGYVTSTEIERCLNDEPDNQLADFVAVNGQSVVEDPSVWQPSFADNLRYFINYQVNYMYWRYFMWNFAGRQNDFQGNGEPHLGNWISGIPFIDNARLGDQSLLPEEYTTGNAGHNVFYMLPLLLGLLGIIWQAMMKHESAEKRGIEQFWVVFFLFFMTGLAIVLYLNQTPGQPRERDYAYAGSFYAFAIWIGLGIPAIYQIIRALLRLIVNKTKKNETGSPTPESHTSKADLAIACFAALVAIVIPLQMVSQTWDDHDRSGRYAARDFGMNYLNSLDDNAIIFVNGDNDTFPLWYAQEVEGVRTDVKVVNLSYLTTDWYARQVAAPSYEAEGVPFYMPFTSMNYGQFGSYAFDTTNDDSARDITAAEALKTMYKRGADSDNRHYMLGKHINAAPGEFPYQLDNISGVYVPIDSTTLINRFGSIPGNLLTDDEGIYRWYINPAKYYRSGGINTTLTYDIIARTSTEGFKRPVYFATTVGDSYYLGFRNNMYNTGMAYMVTPFDKRTDESPVAAKAYCNVIGKFRWGGIDAGQKIYLDETVRRMVSSTRLAILTIAEDLLDTPDKAAPAQAVRISKQKGLPTPKTYADMASNILAYMTEHMPTSVAPYEGGIELDVAQIYLSLANITHNTAYLDKAAALANAYLDKAAKMLNYATTLDEAEYQAFINAERRTVYLSYRAVGMIDYINVARAVLSGKKDIDIPVDDLDYALATFSNAEAVLVANAFRNTDNELIAMASILEDNGSQMSRTYNDAYNIAIYTELAGLKPYVTADKFLATAGMKPSTWGRLLNGYDLQPKQLVDEAKQLLKYYEENPPRSVADNDDFDAEEYLRATTSYNN